MKTMTTDATIESDMTSTAILKIRSPRTGAWLGFAVESAPQLAPLWIRVRASRTGRIEITAAELQTFFAAVTRQAADRAHEERMDRQEREEA